jgi:voltage-gated sodium channel
MPKVLGLMTTKLFGAAFPDWFGSIGASLYSLFQIMTLEAWSDGIVRPIMEVYPLAWMFFIPFILITSFIVLNLFIAIIVNAMHGIDREQAVADEQGLSRQIALLREEISALRAERVSGNATPIAHST